MPHSPEKTVHHEAPTCMLVAGHLDELHLEDCVRRGSLCSPDWAHVRVHLDECSTCRERFAEISEFVAFMRASPEDTAGHIQRRHTTTTGTVFLVVSGSDAGMWEGRVIGGGYDVVRTFWRGPEAKHWLEEWFERTLAASTASEDARWR